MKREEENLWKSSCGFFEWIVELFTEFSYYSTTINKSSQTLPQGRPKKINFTHFISRSIFRYSAILWTTPRERRYQHFSRSFIARYGARECAKEIGSLCVEEGELSGLSSDKSSFLVGIGWGMRSERYDKDHQTNETETVVAAVFWREGSFNVVRN